MKVILLNGSPRTEGNTKKSLEIVSKKLIEEGIEAEIIQLGGNTFSGCRACGGCGKNKNGKCVITGDKMNEIMEKVFKADGLVIGSPTYFSNVTTEIKAFIDRCGYVNRANGGFLRGKPGTAVVVARRAGGNFVYSAINFFFGIAEMPIASSSYWNLGIAGQNGDVMEEEEAVKTFETLGVNLAKMVKK